MNKPKAEENAFLNLAKQVLDLSEDQKRLLSGMEAMSNKSHTESTLKALTKEVEEPDLSESDTKSYSNAFMKGRRAERKRVLSLINNHMDNE